MGTHPEAFGRPRSRRASIYMVMLRSLLRVSLLASTSALQLPRALPAIHVAAAPANARAHTFASASTLEDEIKSTIASDKVVVFSKDYCPFCLSTKKLLDGMGVKYTTIEINLLPNGPDYQAALTTISGQRTVPNVFIGGTHLGGNDDTQRAAKSGKLAELLK